MNKFFSILISVTILLSFSFCCASKKNVKTDLQDKHPFAVTNSTYKTWVGGQPGVRGISIYITIDNSEIKLDSVFFRNMKTELNKEINSDPSVFVGSFMLPNTEKEFILDENPIKEYGNKVPSTTLIIPFELKEDEAVISYTFEGENIYYKISDLIESKTKIH